MRVSARDPRCARAASFEPQWPDLNSNGYILPGASRHSLRSRSARCARAARRAMRTRRVLRDARCAHHTSWCVMGKKVPTASFLRHFVFASFLRFSASTDSKYASRALQFAYMYSIQLSSLLLSTWFGLWRPLERPLEVPTASFFTFNGYISRVFAFFSLY